MSLILLQKKTISFTFPTNNVELIEQCKKDVGAIKKLLFFYEKQGFTTLVFS